MSNGVFATAALINTEKANVSKAPAANAADAVTFLNTPFQPTAPSMQAPAAPLVDPVLIAAVRKLLTLSDGRDKAMKFIQYAGKFILWAWLRRKTTKPNARRLRHTVLATRLAALVSTLSTTRKMIRLAHVVEPACDLAGFITGSTPPPSLPSTPQAPITSAQRSDYLRDLWLYRISFLGAAVGILNDLGDDIYVLAKIGALEKSWAAPADKWANRFWLFGIVVDLLNTANDLAAAEEKNKKFMRSITRVPLTGETRNEKGPPPSQNLAELAKLREKRYWLRVTFLKFLMDGIFCSWDVFEFKGSDGWQICAGWASGILSGYKLWCKVKSSCS